MQVIDCVRQKIHEKQLQKEIATTQKQLTMVQLHSLSSVQFFVVSGQLTSFFRNNLLRAKV
jgi:hypothetical protein